MKRYAVGSRQHWGYVFISPYFIVFFIFGFYPFLHTLALSFQAWDGIRPATQAGFANFSRLLGDKTLARALTNTVSIWLGNYIPQILTALLLSGLFTFSRIRGVGFFKAAFYLPNLITAASVGLLFNLLLNGDKSVVNQLLLQTGLIEKPVGFLTSSAIAPRIVSYIQWWMWFGYTTILIMAGMSTVEESVYEAAMVDGAGPFRTYCSVTLPLIRPTVLYLTVTSIIGGMQLFDVPAVLTDGLGAPQKSILTAAMYIYNQAFRNHNYGYASAVSVSVFLIILLLSALSLLLTRRKGDG